MVATRWRNANLCYGPSNLTRFAPGCGSGGLRVVTSVEAWARIGGHPTSSLAQMVVEASSCAQHQIN
jgi:hypothetical protein